MISDSFMIIMAHCLKTAVTVHHSGLRRPEALSRKQLIAEIPRVDSHQNSCLIKLVLFYLSQKLPL